MPCTMPLRPAPVAACRIVARKTTSVSARSSAAVRKSKPAPAVRKATPAPAKAGMAAQRPRTAPAAASAAVRSLPSKGSKTRRRKRASIGSNFESHEAMERAKQGREVDELMALIPPSVATALLGGKLAEEQLPDAPRGA